MTKKIQILRNGYGRYMAEVWEENVIDGSGKKEFQWNPLPETWCENEQECLRLATKALVNSVWGIVKTVDISYPDSIDMSKPHKRMHFLNGADQENLMN